MELTDKLKAIPVHNCLGKPCWTASGAATAIGMHRNTIIRWAKKTMNGELNMPMLRAPMNKSDIHIPIQEFMAWYEYTQN